MNTTQLIYNSISNLSYYGFNSTSEAGSNQYVCELNQYNMIAHVQKFPKVAFWIAVIITACLFIDFLILPRFIDNRFVNSIHGLFSKTAMILTPLLIFLLSITTYPISQQTMEQVINPILKGVAVLFFIIIIYDNRKPLIELYRKITKERNEEKKSDSSTEKDKPKID